MLKKKALVIAKEGDNFILEFERDSLCGCCKNIFCPARKKEKIIIKDREGLNPGEEVYLTLEEGGLALLSCLTFLLPSLLFILFLIIFKKAGILLSFLLGLTGLAFYFIVLKLILSPGLLGKKFSCKVVRKGV